MSLVTALAAPLRRGAGLARLAFAMILLPGVFLTALAAVFWFAKLRPSFLVSSALWTLLFVIGGVMLLRRGLARPEGARPAAEAWPRGRLAIATLAASAAFLLVFEQASAESHRRLADLVAGHRAVLASLDPGPVSDDENAALGHQEAFEQLDSLSGFPDWFNQCGAPCRSDASKPEDLERLARVSQPTLRLLRRAAARPRYRFAAFDYVDPVRTPFPSLLHYRRAANLLAWDAVERARQGDTAAAAADVVASWRMAGHLVSGGHSLLEHLMGVGVQGIGTDALEDALAARSGWRAEELAALAAAAQPSFRHALIRALSTEESTFVLLCSNLEMNRTFATAPSDPNELVSLLQPLPGMSAAYRIYVLPEDVRSYSEWISAVREQLRQGQNTQKDWAALESSVVLARKGPLTSIALPSMLRARHSVVAEAARVRLARLAVAAVAYELETRKYPATLDELVPRFITAVPVDPFDNKPLKMVAADGGLVLYSVGADAVDDGGVEKHRGAGSLDGDITFCLGPASAARGRGRPKAGRS